MSGLSILSGCSTLSGFDAGSEFSCSAPDGVSCKSVSGVYANAKAGNLPSQKKGIDGHANANANANVNSKQEFSYINAPSIKGQANQTTQPIYNQEKVLRVWFAPWEDKDEMLHDQSFSYITYQEGSWNLEHIKKEVSKQSTTFSINQ